MSEVSSKVQNQKQGIAGPARMLPHFSPPSCYARLGLAYPGLRQTPPLPPDLASLLPISPSFTLTTVSFDSPSFCATGLDDVRDCHRRDPRTISLSFSSSQQLRLEDSATPTKFVVRLNLNYLSPRCFPCSRGGFWLDFFAEQNPGKRPQERVNATIFGKQQRDDQQ